MIRLKNATYILDFKPHKIKNIGMGWEIFLNSKYSY